jgi:hypothetical protein
MEHLLLLAVLICAIANFFVLVYGFYRMRRMLRGALSDVREELSDVFIQATQKQYSQLEALTGLMVELGFKKSLPATRGWAASPDFLREVALHVLQSHPKVIVECGSGVSTVVLARCMQMNGSGHVFSLDHSPEYAEKTRRELERHHLKDWATVLTAPLRPYKLNGEIWPWYCIDELPQIGFDMMVIDGPPWFTSTLARYPTGPLLFHCLNASAAVFLDDADRQQEQTILRRWAEEFPEFRQEMRNCEKGCGVLWKDTETLHDVNAERCRQTSEV